MTMKAMTMMTLAMTLVDDDDGGDDGDACHNIGLSVIAEMTMGIKSPQQ